MGADQSGSSFKLENAELSDEASDWLALANDGLARSVFTHSRSDERSGRSLPDRAMERMVKAAEDELRRRKERARFLPAELFGEGAWSMLLDLFICQYRGKKVSTTSACIAADVPGTTALRWLEVLEAKGLVQRSPTAADKRVKHVSLTAKAHDALCALLSRQLM